VHALVGLALALLLVGGAVAIMARHQGQGVLQIDISEPPADLGK
jgi:hypothetical protein